MSTPLSQDPRWQRLQSKPWKCTSCNEEHRGLMDFAVDSPAYWQGDEPPRPNKDIIEATHILTEDFCIIKGEKEQHFFVRAVLPLPIIGAGDEWFSYGVWSSLSLDSFNAYLEIFENDRQSDQGPWFGYLSNHLNGYPETLNLKVQVQPQDNRQRPILWLHEDNPHPLAIEQYQGISLDRILELHKINGHDLTHILYD